MSAKLLSLTISLSFFSLINLFAANSDNCPPIAAADTVYSIEAVSVTGSRTPMQLGASARIVTVLDSLTLASLPAQSVNDLLKYSVGVDVRQRGMMGMQSDISVRGGTCEQIAVLLNGINICDPQTGHNAVDFPVSTNEIDHIEILEGPAARVYGTSSLVGAINIVTKQSRENCGNIYFDSGSYGLVEAGARLNLSKGNLVNTLSASRSHSDGYSVSSTGKPNSDFSATKAFWSGSYEARAFDCSWQLGYSLKDFGSNTFYSARFDDQFEHTEKIFAAVKASTKGRLRFTPSVYWNNTRDRFELIRANPEQVPFNHHKTNVYGVNLGADFTTVAGRTAFGAEFREEDIVSTNLGEPMAEPDGVYKCFRNRNNISIYLDHSLVLDRFTASAGVTANRNSATHEGFGFYPGADLSFRISDAWKLYASWNSSLRMPSYTELYYSVGGHKADKNLNPEKLQAVEGGVKFLRPGVRVILSVYWHQGRDLIDWIKDLSQGDDAVWTSVNHARVITLGEELSLHFDLPVLLGRPEFPLTRISLAYAHIDQNRTLEENIQSAYALEYLRNKFVAQMDLRICSRLFLNLSCRWNDRVGSYEKFENGASTGKTVPYEPYTLLNARLGWNSSNMRIYLEGDNLLNRPYYDHGNIPQPGAWFKFGISRNFNF